MLASGAVYVDAAPGTPGGNGQGKDKRNGNAPSNCKGKRDQTHDANRDQNQSQHKKGYVATSMSAQVILTLVIVHFIWYFVTRLREPWAMITQVAEINGASPTEATIPETAAMPAETTETAKAGEKGRRSAVVQTNLLVLKLTKNRPPQSYRLKFASKCCVNDGVRRTSKGTAPRAMIAHFKSSHLGRGCSGNP